MIKFGTSGFRGIIADNFTKENIQKIGFAFRQIVEANKKKVNVVIGHDNRFLGREFVEWFCEAACCDLIHATVMTVSVPTPLIAFKAVTSDYGVMITASHNPFFFNGIAFLLSGGKDANDDFYALITKNLNDPKSFAETSFSDLQNSGIVTLSDITDDYSNKILSIIDINKIKTNKLKVLFNPMHGSSTAIMKGLMDTMGIDYRAINDNVDPNFGNGLPAPYPRNLIEMAKSVVSEGYNFGFALDGDGDRITFIDDDGKMYDCNYLAAVFYYYFTEIKKQKRTLIKSYFTSNLAARVAKKYGCEVRETKVGFKFLGEELERNPDSLMAAESAGIAFRAVSLKKDAIVAASILIEILADTKKTIGEIIKFITEETGYKSVCTEFAYPIPLKDSDTYIQKLIAPTVPNFDRRIIGRDSFPDGYRLRFEDDYWCAVRKSGTESVVRFFSEMPTEAEGMEIIGKLENFYNLHERQK